MLNTLVRRHRLHVSQIWTMIAFVERRQQDRLQADRPQAVVGFFRTDLLIGQGVGDVEQPFPEPEGAAGGAALDEEMPGVLQLRQSYRIRSR